MLAAKPDRRSEIYVGKARAQHFVRFAPRSSSFSMASSVRHRPISADCEWPPADGKLRTGTCNPWAPSFVSAPECR